MDQSTQTRHDAHVHSEAETGGLKSSLLFVAIVALLVGIWAFAINSFGFTAFIYPLLGLVAAAFAFTLVLTRA